MKRIVYILIWSLAAGVVQAAVITSSFNASDGDYNNAENWSTTGIPGQNASGADFDRGVINSGRIATTSANTPAPINTDGIIELTIGNNADGAALNIGHNLTGLKTLRVGIGAAGAAGTVNQSAGSLSGVAYSQLIIGDDDSAVAAYNLSGGTYSLDLDATVNQQGTFSLQGDNAVFSVGRNLTLSSSGKLEFVLGETGVNTINVGNVFTVDADHSELVIDGSSYTGGEDSITLINAASMTGSFASGKYSVTGLGAENTGWTLSQGTDGDLVLNVIPEPATISMVSLGALITLIFRKSFAG